MALNAKLTELIQEGFGFPAGTIEVFKSELTYYGLKTPQEHAAALAEQPNAVRQANIALVLYGHQRDENGQIIGDPDKPHKQYLRATGRNEGWFDRNGNGGTEASYRLVNYELNEDGSIDMDTVQHLPINEEIDEETNKYGPQPVGVGIDFPGTVTELGRNTAAAKYIQQLAKLGLDKSLIVEGLPLTGIVPITIVCHQEKKKLMDDKTGKEFEFSEFIVDSVISFPYDQKPAAKSKAAAVKAPAQPVKASAQPTQAATTAKAAPAKAKPSKSAPVVDEDDIKSALDLLLTLGITGSLVEMMLFQRAKPFISTLEQLGLTPMAVAAWLKENGPYTSDGNTVAVNDKNKWLFSAA